MTQALLQRLSASDGAGRWQAVTAAFGAPYIADERSFCVAGHAVLQTWEQAQVEAPSAGYAGVLVGCFGDPGLDALRSSATVPVWGLAEVSLQALWARGAARVAIVTGGEAWKPMLERWVRSHGFDHPAADTGRCITRVQVVSASGGQMMQSPQAAVQVLESCCLQALHGADAVLLGGAGLAGMGERLRTRMDAQVWDCVELVHMHWAQYQAEVEQE